MNSKLESNVCYHVYGWRHLVKTAEVSAGLAENDGLSHLWADCLYTGISSGPTLGNEYRKKDGYMALKRLAEDKKSR